MTSPSGSEEHARGAAPADAERDDDVGYPFAYGHGRMPGFMKVVWIGFLIFITWYVVSFLLPSAATELGN